MTKTRMKRYVDTYGRLQKAMVRGDWEIRVSKNQFGENGTVCVTLRDYTGECVSLPVEMFEKIASQLPKIKVKKQFDTPN